MPVFGSGLLSTSLTFLIFEGSTHLSSVIPFLVFFLSIIFLSSQSANSQSVVWERNFTNNVYADGYFVEQFIDGGYFIVGESSGFGGSGNDRFYIIKTDQYGNLEWHKNLGSMGSQGRGGTITSDGNFATVGWNKLE